MIFRFRLSVPGLPCAVLVGGGAADCNYTVVAIHTTSTNHHRRKSTKLPTIILEQKSNFVVGSGKGSLWCPSRRRIYRQHKVFICVVNFLWNHSYCELVRTDHNTKWISVSNLNGRYQLAAQPPSCQDDAKADRRRWWGEAVQRRWPRPGWPEEAAGPGDGVLVCGLPQIDVGHRKGHPYSCVLSVKYLQTVSYALWFCPLLEAKLPYEPVCPSVVSQLVSWSYLPKEKGVSLPCSYRSIW